MISGVVYFREIIFESLRNVRESALRYVLNCFNKTPAGFPLEIAWSIAGPASQQSRLNKHIICASCSKGKSFKRIMIMCHCELEAHVYCLEPKILAVD